MKTEANKLKQIVLSLRTFSRLDEATMKSVDIHESIDSTLLILQSRLTNPDKHQIIQVIKEYGNLPSVECYPSQINQVFLHILSNAIDAMEGLFVGNNSEQSTIAQPLLRVRTELTPEQTVNIAIANNGPSIPKDIQGTVFNPFFTTKPIGQDAGLGLSISYQIVTEVHKGKLILVSTPEQLTEFIIQIPLHQHQIN
jgi:signal transduction histidine kinase